jgi:hypothetical protein
MELSNVFVLSNTLNSPNGVPGIVSAAAGNAQQASVNTP